MPITRRLLLHGYLISIRQRRVQRLPRALPADRPAERMELAIGRDVPIMFFKAAGEAVMSVAIANKIKEAGAVGVQSRFQSASPRIADWPRRQPWKR